jgi:two-component system NtrC family sensor kinase
MIKTGSAPSYISISTRISILLGLIILVTMTSFSVIILTKQEKDSVDALSRSTLLLSQTTERILRQSMLKNRRSDISAAIREAVNNEGILAIRILNHKGVIKFSSRRTELEQHISSTNRLCATCHPSGDSISIHPVKSFYTYRFDKESGTIYSSLPIYNSPSCYESNCHTTAVKREIKNPSIFSKLKKFSPVHDSTQTILGFIEIEISAKNIKSNLARSRAQLIFLTIIITLVASVIAYLSINYLVGKPVKRLVDGTRRVAQGDFTHEIPPGKAELGVLADSFNIMQRQLLLTQSQLIESEKLASVGKIADEIANEISNPLTGIIIYSESLLEQTTPQDAKRAEYETILKEALRIRESVRNILSITKRESPDFAPVDLNTSVNHAISIIRKLSNFRNIRIVTSMPKNLPKVSADAGLLEQVFLNILLISSDNMESGGILNITANYFDKDRKVEIRFVDKKGSIPQSVLQTLIETGRPWNSTITRRAAISLSVCKDIVTLHKGTIYATSETGGGTSIVIELPA